MLLFRGPSRMIVMVCLLLGLSLAPSVAEAQSLSGGSLRGVVTTANGEPVVGAQVTLESADRSAIRTVETGQDGSFGFSFLTPASYNVLIEQIGFQPVRRLGITVRAGQRAAVRIEIERKPPPVTTVTEIDAPVVTTGLLSGRLVAGSELHDLARFPDLTDGVRGTTSFLSSFDARSGLGLAGLGAPAAGSRLFVDGVPELLVSHPGLPSLAAETPIFSRSGLDQVLIFGSGFDSEWRGSAGPLVAAQTRSGGNRLTFEPYARFSTAKLGGVPAANPSDSAATSFAVGASLRGAIKPDTAYFAVSGDYRSEELPSAFPWLTDSARYRGSPVPLASSLAAIASDSFGTNLAAATSPAVRTWKGGNGLARIDWRFGRRHAFYARAGFAAWKETNPGIATDVGNDAGAGLDARDFSTAAALTSTGEAMANEFRLGVSNTRRDWTDSGLPATIFAAEGVRVGGHQALPGTFQTRVVSLTDAFQLASGPHTIKVGGNVDLGRHEQDYSYGRAGLVYFGDLTEFGAGRGLRVQTTAAVPNAEFTTSDLGLFAEDVWTVSPEFQVVFGIRYDRRRFAAGKLALNQSWLTATEIRTDAAPEDSKGVSPRVGFVWDVRGAGTWVIRGGAGWFVNGLDPRLFAEAVTTGGGLTVRRAFGTGDWPTGLPAGGTTGTALTFFTDKFRAPRTAKAEAGLEGLIGSGITLQVNGGYYHTDYLPRRLDLNRPTGLGLTTEGRPLFGTLAKSAGLVYAVPGSNRRFADFDLVSALVPTGFVDHYEATLALERRSAVGLTMLASYTYSKTQDNIVGRLTADPADQLNPFPGGLDGKDWTDGRSDLDIPHRVAATFQYRTRGPSRVQFTGRWRWRSGLPFTAGFRPGVDVNGDGGGGNDPAFLDSAVPNVAEALNRGTCGQGATNGFAIRNGCRERSVQSLDLGFKFALPIATKGGSRVMISADAFNVVSTTTGATDRALFLVDPAGALSGTARIRLPLVTNPGFGTLQNRRGEPRFVRLGLSIEY